MTERHCCGRDNDKLQFNGAPRRCLFESFYVAFFKKRPLIQRAERWSPPQRRNSFCGISFLLSFFLWASGVKEKSGQTVTISKTGFLFLRMPFLYSTSAFLLLPLAQKKSLAKENAVGCFASAEATNAPRVGSAPPFEKGGRKLLRRHRREVTDKSKFETISHLM